MTPLLDLTFLSSPAGIGSRSTLPRWVQTWGNQIGVDEAQTEDLVSGPPEHQFAISRAQWRWSYGHQAAVGGTVQMRD
jgi:hypothetical protein